MKLVLQDWKYGRILRYTNDMYIGDSIGLYGEYSEFEVDIFRQLVKSGDVVIDVGANIGAFTVPLAQIVGEKGRVYAFEPQRVTFQVLCGNVALNNLSNVWTYNKGVGKIAGKIKINENLLGGNNGCFNIQKCKGEYEVDIVTLDSLGLQRCDFIKIDAEGMDMEVIEGAWKLIETCKPIISVEAAYNESGRKVVAKLYNLGYEIYIENLPMFEKNNYFETIRDIFIEPENFLSNTIKKKSKKKEVYKIVHNYNWLCVPKSKNLKVMGMNVLDESRWQK